MAEYERAQRNQLGRAIVYNGGGNKQLKEIMDNRIQKVIQQQKDVRTTSTGLIRSVPNDYILLEGEEFVTGNEYPLGFESEQQFRDSTRSLAQRYRELEIIVRGSSVTGHKFSDPTKLFRAESDIDMGVVGTIPDDVDGRGFPLRKTRLGRYEKRFRESMFKRIGHPTGIRFFDRRPEGPLIVRPHTPPPQRSPKG